MTAGSEQERIESLNKQVVKTLAEVKFSTKDHILSACVVQWLTEIARQLAISNDRLAQMRVDAVFAQCGPEQSEKK